VPSKAELAVAVPSAAKKRFFFTLDYTGAGEVNIAVCFLRHLLQRAIPVMLQIEAPIVMAIGSRSLRCLPTWYGLVAAGNRKRGHILNVVVDIAHNSRSFVLSTLDRPDRVSDHRNIHSANASPMGVILFIVDYSRDEMSCFVRGLIALEMR
jgi:hypothetical protein